MKCQGVMEFMQRFLDHDLGEQEHQMMKNHMEQCTSCANMFERLNRLSNELVHLPKVVPPFSIVDSIMPRLDEIDRQSRQVPGIASTWTKFKRYLTMRSLGGLAATGVLLIIVFTQGPQWFDTGSRTAERNSAQDSGAEASMNEVGAGGSTMSIASSEQMRIDQSGDVSFKVSMDTNANGSVPSAYERSVEPEARMFLTAQDHASELMGNSSLLSAYDELNPVFSPDGSYSAYIEMAENGLQVIVLNHQGERIYASPLKQADDVLLLSWSEDGLSLDYSLTTNGGDAMFTIYVDKRMEVQN